MCIKIKLIYYVVYYNLHLNGSMPFVHPGASTLHITTFCITLQIHKAIHKLKYVDTREILARKHTFQKAIAVI